MVGLVELFDPVQRFADRQPGRIDFLRLTDNPGDRPQSSGHSQRAGVGERGEPAIEHARIELVRLPIEIEIGAREAGSDERGAQGRDAREQSINESVFRPAKRRLVQLALNPETGVDRRSPEWGDEKTSGHVSWAGSKTSNGGSSSGSCGSAASDGFDSIKSPFRSFAPPKPLAANQFVRDIEAYPALFRRCECATW